MTFEDLDNFFHGGLELPIGGKTYSISSPDFHTGLQVQRLLELGAKQSRLIAKRRTLEAKRQAGEAINEADEITAAEELTSAEVASLQMDDDSELEYYARLLGPAHTEMVNDGVSLDRIKHAGVTTSLWIGIGLEAAERYWASAGKPPAPPEPNRAAKRAASKAAGSTTRRPASTSGTRARGKK